jgi:hypothetical protein
VSLAIGFPQDQLMFFSLLPGKHFAGVFGRQTDDIGSAFGTFESE